MSSGTYFPPPVKFPAANLLSNFQRTVKEVQKVLMSGFAAFCYFCSTVVGTAKLMVVTLCSVVSFRMPMVFSTFLVAIWENVTSESLTKGLLLVDID